MGMNDIISSVFSGFMIIGGLLSIFLQPMEDELGLAESVKNTVNTRYIRARYVSGICFIIIAIAGFFGISPALSYSAGFYPLYVMLVFALYGEALMSICDAEYDRAKMIKRLCFLIPVIPLWILSLYMPEKEAISFVGWAYLIFFIGIYTMQFIGAYKYLNDCCCNTVDLGTDYDILPDSMPWVARLYLGAVMLSAFSALSAVAESQWSVFLSVAAHLAYFTWFIYRFLYTYSRFSKVLAHYQTSTA